VQFLGCHAEADRVVDRYDDRLQHGQAQLDHLADVRSRALQLFVRAQAGIVNVGKQLRGLLQFLEDGVQQLVPIQLTSDRAVAHPAAIGLVAFGVVIGIDEVDK
jgi:hypothetical protein